MGITTAEWLAAIEEAERETAEAELQSDAITIVEFAALIGMGRMAATDRMRLLEQQGKAERTTKMIRRSDGHRVHVTAYRLKEPEKRKGKAA